MVIFYPFSLKKFNWHNSLTRKKRARFCNANSGVWGVQLCTPHLTSPTDQLETRIRRLPCTPIFGYGLFNGAIPGKMRCLLLPEIQDGGRKDGSSNNFWTAWDNDAISTSTPTFSTRPDLNMTLSTLPDIYRRRPPSEFEMAATDTGSGNNYWT